MAFCPKQCGSIGRLVHFHKVSLFLFTILFIGIIAFTLQSQAQDQYVPFEDNYPDTGKTTSAPAASSQTQPSSFSGNIVSAIRGSEAPESLDTSAVVNPAQQLIMMQKQMEIIGAEKLPELISTYQSSQQLCKDKQFNAETFCLEHLSPDITKGAAAINTILSGLTTSTSNNCSKIGSAMDLAKGAFSAFGLNCGAQKLMCDSACGKAKTALTQIQSIAEKAEVNPNNPVCMSGEYELMSCLQSFKNTVDPIKVSLKNAVKQELIVSDKRSVAGKVKTCAGYIVPLASSALGIVSMIQKAKEANKCQDDTAATNIAQPTTPILDCSLPENAQMVTCICKNNPRSAGCGTNTTAPQTAKFGGSSASITSTSGTDSGANLSMAGGDPGITQGEFKSSGSSSSPGGASGGGSGLLGGSGSSGGAESGGSGKAGVASKKLNTNIYSSEGGGGGGSMGYGRGVSSTSSMQQYLPGGAKDPTIVANSASKQISSPAGRDNWQKISERYSTSRPSLLGGGE